MCVHILPKGLYLHHSFGGEKELLLHAPLFVLDSGRCCQDGKEFFYEYQRLLRTVCVGAATPRTCLASTAALLFITIPSHVECALGCPLHFLFQAPLSITLLALKRGTKEDTSKQRRALIFFSTAVVFIE